MLKPSHAIRVDVDRPNKCCWIRSIAFATYVAEALNTTMSEHLQYELKAWIEGGYARQCGQGSDKCPYEHFTPMALAWLRGWRYEENPTSRSDAEDRPDVSP
jgi:hypothetical protein